MPTPMIRVRARGDGALPLVDVESGALLRGRFAGRAPHAEHPAALPGAPLPKGELVAANAYYLKAVEHGDLELVDEGDDETPAPAAAAKKGGR
jgi:hypothetical protein